MRPQYIAPVDLHNESRLSAIVELKMNCNLVKLPASYKLDCGLYRDDEMKALVELKCRSCDFGHYPTIILATGKWLAACTWIDLGYPCYFVVGFHDGVYVHELATFGYAIKHSGRTDRNDAADEEPCIHIPNSQWRRLT